MYHMSCERCFFFGCGSSGWLDRCFERTGTAFVVRVATRGVSGSGKRGPEAGGGLDSETGFRSAGLWLGELLRHVDGLKLKEVEDLIAL